MQQQQPQRQQHFAMQVQHKCKAGCHCSITSTFYQRSSTRIVANKKQHACDTQQHMPFKVTTPDYRCIILVRMVVYMGRWPLTQSSGAAMTTPSDVVGAVNPVAPADTMIPESLTQPNPYHAHNMRTG
jgi:hypothetical protein